MPSTTNDQSFLANPMSYLGPRKQGDSRGLSNIRQMYDRRLANGKGRYLCINRPEIVPLKPIVEEKFRRA